MEQEQKIWSHPRDVIIKYPARGRPEQVVGFRVEQAGKDAFQKIFEDYLKFCDDKQAILKFTDVIDAESGQVCSLTVEIHGEHHLVGPEMQRIGNSLLQHATQIK